ncbi:MAG: type II toxin-antitoxin system VapC family toxin [Candidatus Bathyarchaeota archaeon]
MSFRYVIDSCAWIEYFRGTRIGEEARQYIEGREAATATITIVELREKYLREGWNCFDEDLAFITSRTLIVPLDKSLAVLAGEINHSMKQEVKRWGISDSIILATAKSTSAKVVTGDQHFKEAKEAIFLENRTV